MMSSLVTMLSALIANSEINNVTNSGTTLDAPRLERIFIFALVWTVGGLLESADRIKVDIKLRSLTNNLPDTQAPDSVYEFRVSEASGEWEHWGSQVADWEAPDSDLGSVFASILIPTVDSVRCLYLLDLALAVRRPALLIGGAGTGKTSAVLQVSGKDALPESVSLPPSTMVYGQ